MRSTHAAILLGLACCQQWQHADRSMPITPSNPTTLSAGFDGRCRLRLTPDTTSTGRRNAGVLVLDGTLILRVAERRAPDGLVLVGSAAFSATKATALGDRPLVQAETRGDSVWLSIGRCRATGEILLCGSDNGALLLRGVARGDSVTGRWSESVYCCGDSGSFALQRQP